MKVAVISLVLFCNHLIAQKGLIIHFDSLWAVTNQKTAPFYRKCFIDTLTNQYAGKVVDYYSTGKTYMVGFYQNGKKHGSFTFYHSNGNIASKGNYREDMRVGTWQTFYPTNVPRDEIDFSVEPPRALFLRDSTGRKLLNYGNGIWKEEYWESGKKYIIQGSYSNDLKEGEWTCKTSTGELVYLELFRHGRFVMGLNGKNETYNKSSEAWFMEPYSIAATEFFIKEWKKDNEEHKLNPILNSETTDNELTAHPEGGLENLYKEIAPLIKYPAQARRMQVEGRVFLEFIVEKDGSISEIKVVRGIGAGCDEEAIRVLKAASEKVKWIPASHKGISVRSKYNMALLFRLKAEHGVFFKVN